MMEGLHPAMIYYVLYGIIFSSVYFYTKNFCIYDSACFKQLILCMNIFVTNFDKIFRKIINSIKNIVRRKLWEI